MSGFPDPQVLVDLARVLHYVLQPNEDPEHQALMWIINFKEKNPNIIWVAYLILYFSDANNPEANRAVAAIYLYTALHKRTPDAQRRFVAEYLKYDLAMRDKMRIAAIQNLSATQDSLIQQSLNLLGLFFSLEFSSVCPRDAIQPGFKAALEEMFNLAQNSPYPNVRTCMYRMFEVLVARSLDMKESCTQDPPYHVIANKLFEVLITGMEWMDAPELQIQAICSMTECLPMFKRTFSFKEPNRILVGTILTLMQMGIPAFVTPTYDLLRRYIDNYYPYVDPHMKDITAITLADMRSGIEMRQIDACFLWSTIGEVEGDILTEDKRLVKRRHRGFDRCYGYSNDQFDAVFEVLVQMIASTDPEQTDAHIQLDHSISHAAFSCFASMTRATDARALVRIFQFVMAFSQHEDWRVRYTAALLLNAGSQLPSFREQVKDILVAYQWFVNAIADPINRISEVAMWSLGRMIEEVPDLVTDPERFAPLVGNLAAKMNVSDELTSRGCWLLNCCFGAFSCEEAESPLVANFDSFANMLLDAADNESNDDAQDAAYGALSRLIERTPPNIAEAYNRLFEKLTAKLGALLEFDNCAVGRPKHIQQMIGLLSLIQAIVMNVGPMISNVAGELMQLLVMGLEAGNSDYVCEVLPAMGAVARAIKVEFAPFLPELLPRVFVYLEQEPFVQPAAVFAGDIFDSIPGISGELANHFVEMLFAALMYFDNLTPQARLACFTALSAVAKYVGNDGMGWIEKYTEMLEAEARSVLSVDDETIDPDIAKSFAIENLQIYQTLVPIMASVTKGDRKVRNFFHIFEKIVKLSCMDESVLPDVVILVRLIAITFQRKMSVYLNKPAVQELLRKARSSEDPALAELACETCQIVRTF